MTALTGSELLAWLEQTASGWRGLIEANPRVLSFPCSTRETHNVAELLQHIVAVELRYAERLQDQPETAYEQLAFGSAQEIFAVHTRAMELIAPLLLRNSDFWDETIIFSTRSAGVLHASRRKVLVHLALHGIRHYAQLATLVREQGVAPDWPMDYLFADIP